MNIKLNWDGVGILTSVICAIHCGLLPILVPIFPLFGVNIVHNLFFEWCMIVLAFLVGAYSLVHGFFKHHRSFLPLSLFLAGFVFLVAKQFFKSQEYLLLAFAVPLIISAHYINFKYCHRNKCSSPHHKH
jgi:hypothetical protein